MEVKQKAFPDKFILLNDFTTCYNDLGTGSVPVIFIHGFPFDKSSWHPQMEFLSDKFRVISYDIRGFGKSTAETQIESIHQFADDLINFMDALNINKAIVCGLSMGGYILLNAISLYPERFYAIVLSDTQCIADSESVKQKRIETISQILAGGFQSFAEEFVKKIFCTETLDTKPELVEKILNTILSTSSITVTKTLNALANRNDMCNSLHQISIPAMIICGSDDVITPPKQSEFLHNSIRGSRTHLINNAGHLTNLEQPGEFNNYLINFISDVLNQMEKSSI